MKTQEKKFRPSAGKGNRTCRRCGTHRGIIRRADLMICRRCFREIGESYVSKDRSKRRIIIMQMDPLVDALTKLELMK